MSLLSALLYRPTSKNKKVSLLSYVDSKCLIAPNVAITHFTKVRRVNLDSYSYIGAGCTITECDIGRYCSIGPGVKIGLGKHPTNFVSTSPIFYNPNNILGINVAKRPRYQEFARTIIKNDVWIGANAIILDGITIGNGAVIAAGAVVTKDVPDYSIVGGVPAKVIKYRFDHLTINKIVESEWWNKEANELEKNIKDFLNIEDFIKRDGI